MWAKRVGEAVRTSVLAMLDIAAIFTELLRQVAIVLDDAVDALEEALAKKE